MNQKDVLQANAAVSQMIVSRLREARHLCGLSQIEAAARLGFANSSGLCKLEQQGATHAVPLWVLARAARVYEVSVDYLMGLTDDWEADARLTERATAHWVYEAWAKARERDLKAMAALDIRVREIAEKAGLLANQCLTVYFESDRTPAMEGIKQRAEAVRRMLEKLKLHKNDAVQQCVINLVKDGV